MKNILAVCVLSITLTMTGCTAQQTAQNISNVVAGILSIAQQEEQALPPADVAVMTPWVTLGISLNAQTNTCIAAAGNTKAKLATCLTTFVGGLLSPQELAQLRILSPATQKKVQLYATAALIAINGALTQWGQPAQPNPTIAPATSAADLRVLSAQLRAEGFLP